MVTCSKICIVSFENLNRAPYIEHYSAILEGSFDLIYWNRNGIKEYCKGANNVYSYNHKANNGHRGIDYAYKLCGYLAFPRYAMNIIRKNKYDGIILLQGQLGVLLYPLLRKLYQNKYILEIRDYWQENHKWYYNPLSKAIERSYTTVISSPAYKRFLPEHDYVIAHNISMIDQDIIKNCRSKNPIKDRVVLSCVGGAKYIEYDKKIIQVFKNDDRFLLRYIGRGYEGLKDYCENESIRNVYIEGAFPQDKTLQYYLDTDMILNLYGNHSPKLDYALSNKLYYSAMLGEPIIVCPDTYMAETVSKYNLGYVFDKDKETSKNELYEYIVNLDKEIYIRSCDVFLGSVDKEMQVYKNMIYDFSHHITANNHNSQHGN